MDISADELRQSFSSPPTRGLATSSPSEKDGEFWLFYLHEVRSDPKPGTPWNLVTTTDLTQFEDQGVALPPRNRRPTWTSTSTRAASWSTTSASTTRSTPDRIPSTAAPDGLPAPAGHARHQHRRHAVLAAAPRATPSARPAGYETADWRDPFVFWDDEAGLWRMLITARHADGPERRRGVIAQCVSTRPVHLGARRAVLGPASLRRPRVPRGVRVGRLVVPRLLRVPRVLHHPLPDGHGASHGPGSSRSTTRIDGRAFYAAKSAERDGRRFFFGWIATRRRQPTTAPGSGPARCRCSRREQNARTARCASTRRASSATRFGTRTRKPDLPAGTVLAGAPDGYARRARPGADAPTAVPPRARCSTSRPGTTECGDPPARERGRRRGLRPPPRAAARAPGVRPLAAPQHRRRSSGRSPATCRSPSNSSAPADLAPGEHTLEVIVDGDLCVADARRRRRR